MNQYEQLTRYIFIVYIVAMKSGFVELIVKRALGGKPVHLEPRSQRYRPIESFKKYLKQTLPNMEHSIQLQILKKSLLKISNPSIRKQLVNAYLRRLFRLRVYEKDEIKNYKNLVDTQPEPISNLVDPIVLKDVNLHSEYDVGFYCLYGEPDMRKVFKNGCFGRYTDEEWASTRKFGIQIRQQSISIGGVMTLINKHLGQKKANPSKIATWKSLSELPHETLLTDYINNHQKFPILFMQLSREIYQHAQKYRTHPEYLRVWGSSIVCDVIANSVLTHGKGWEEMGVLVEKIVDEVMKVSPLPSPNDFTYRFKTLPGTQIPTQSQLPKNCRFYLTTPSFKSFFLGGQSGTGKSMILAYLTMHAHKNNWITITVPNAYKWTQYKKTKYIRAYNGLYLIQEHAVQWLDQFITANKEILENRAVSMQEYGRCDVTGVREDQADPVPNIYIEERRTYFNQISDKFTHRVQEEEETLRQQAKKRITLILSKPKNLYEIGLAGIKNPEYATCAMGELLRQVYLIQDIPMIECVDSFSYLYRPTAYASFRYYNDKDLWGKIPPYHVAHCRMFCNLDGHKLPYGIKVVASSNYPMYMHKFNIKMMMYPENYEHKVQNLTPQQFKNAAQFNILNKWWPADEMNRLNLMYAYTITQGNWGGFQDLMKSGHYL